MPKAKQPATPPGRPRAESKKAAPKKRGRPSGLTKVKMDQVEKLAKAGWTDAQMAEFFGVTPRTWENWKQASPEFFQSLKDWKAEADHKVERSLLERALGYTHPEEKIFQNQGEIIRAETLKHYPPDTTAAIFWLKNRKPAEWRDKQEVEHSGDALTGLLKLIDGETADV